MTGVLESKLIPSENLNLAIHSGSKRGRKTRGKAELKLNSMNPKTSNNQPKLINIQLDCYFSGKITTSDEEEMPIKTSNLADKL
jgi:hypothetical protein